MQLSTLIGKPILSPAGQAYGYVTEARPTRDFTQIACLVCADGDEEEFYLPGKAILSAGDGVIAGKSRLNAPAGVPSPVGKTAYAQTGEALGVVSDLLLGEGEEGVLAVSREGVRMTVPVSRALIAEHVVVYPNEAARRAASRTAASKPSAENRRTPRKKPAHAAAETASAAPMPEKEAPKIALLNHTNLLGRRVKRSLFDSFGNPVALAGERVTPSILSLARRKNLLVKLTVNTLTE